MGELTEKREYYEDRALKAVYTVDGETKQGKYTEYFRGGDVKIETNYDQGALDGRYVERDYDGNVVRDGVYEKGVERSMICFDKYERTETYSENGEVVRIVQKNHDGTGIFKDMEIRNGEEWNGYVNGCDRRVKSYTYWPDEFHEQKYTVKDGKREGEYIEKGIEENHDARIDIDIKASYENGLLSGPYHEEKTERKYTYRYVSDDHGPLECRSSTHILTRTAKDGNYVAGNFTGTVEETRGRSESDKTEWGDKTISKYVDGQLESVEEQTKRWSEYHTSSIKRPNGECVEYKWDGGRIEYQQKDGKKDGLYREVTKAGWVSVEATYSNGQLNGFYKELNSDGTVATKKVYQDGQDVTEKYAKLRTLAAKNLGLPKRGKIKKQIDVAQYAVNSLLNGRKK